jgi:septal ring factor EnvC (AmiA/AmiB activator)
MIRTSKPAAAAAASAALALLLTAMPALPQTAPQIVVPASPPPKSGPKTLGGKAASGKLLSREELRACLKRLDRINADTKTLEGKRAGLDREKEDLVKSADALKAERADVDAKLAAVRDWEGRVRAHSAEIEAFNKRMKEAEEASKSQKEALAKELDADRERLGKARAPLSEDEARLVPAYQTAVKAYNEHALARDGVVNDWNGRNKALNEEGLKHDESRAAWLTECANRPYREDDEIAIKAGK